MLFYIFLAIITTLFYYWGNLSNNKVSRNILLIAAVLIPAIIGGLRDETIGRDMMGYGTVYYDICTSYKSIVDFFVQWHTKEYGYGLLCYLGYAIGNDIHAYLFLSELLKMCLVIYTAYYFRERLNSTILVFIYMLFMYWNGLTMMRQSIALDICLFSMIFVFKKDYTKYIITILIAYTFHSSAVLFMVLLLVIFLYNKTKYPVLIALIASIGAYFSALSIFLYIGGIGIMREELVDLYLDSGVTSSKADIVIVSYMLLSTVMFRKYIQRDDDSKLILCISQVSAVMALLCHAMSSMFEVAYRLAYYPTFALLITIPVLYSSMNNSNVKKLNYFITVVLFLLFYVAYANHGLGDTIPYTSKILGI